MRRTFIAVIRHLTKAVESSRSVPENNTLQNRTARAREGASGSSFFILSCKSLFAVVREQLTRNHAIVELSPFGCWFAEEGFKVRIWRNHIAGVLLVCRKDTAHNLIERFRSLYI